MGYSRTALSRYADPDTTTPNENDNERASAQGLPKHDADTTPSFGEKYEWNEPC
jgi:hypothetical protein